MIVMRGAFLHVERAFRHLEHADVGLVRRAVVVVLEVTGLGAFAAADTDAQVQRITKLHAGLGPVILDAHLRAVACLRLLLQPAQDDLQVDRRKFLVVPLQELLGGDVTRPLSQWGNRLGERRRTEHGPDPLERRAPGKAAGRGSIKDGRAHGSCAAEACADDADDFRTETRSRGGSTGRTSGNAGAWGS
jgi:hypothetical protein